LPSNHDSIILIQESVVYLNSHDYFKDFPMGKKKAITHGGARKGAGRKPGPDGPTVAFTITAPESLVTELDTYAESKGWNRSKAVAEAVRKLLGRK
jgi:hypothetical protein